MANKHSGEGNAAPDALSELVRQVAAGANYRGISHKVIAAVGARELAKRRTLKEAVKATRSKLHQVAGAYFAQPEYDRWLSMLRDAASAGDDGAALKAACRVILGSHASARERLPILDDLYARTLGDLAPIQRVLDVACGLNPLTIPWLPLAPGATYRAYDIYPALADFLNAAFPLLGVYGVAEVADMTTAPPREHADVALVLKALPCLEQLDRDVSGRLLESLDARCLLVTYPVRSLGGRSKGMLATYDERLRALVAGRGWQVTRYEFATELAYVITKR